MIPIPDDEDAFEITRLVDSACAAGPAWHHAQLFMRQTIVVVDGHCQTESYSYRLQADASTKSWLIGWEYYRDPPRPDYAYPLAHVHVSGTLSNGEPIGRFHIPTRRIALELVVWHLIAEWGVDARTKDWSAVLQESITGFDQRRTAH